MAKAKTPSTPGIAKPARNNGKPANGNGLHDHNHGNGGPPHDHNGDGNKPGEKLGLNWLRKWRKKINHPANGITHKELESETRKYLEAHLAVINAFRLPNAPVYRLVSFRLIPSKGNPRTYRGEAYTYPATKKGKHEPTKAKDKKNKNRPEKGGGHLIPAPPPTPPPTDDGHGDHLG